MVDTATASVAGTLGTHFYMCILNIMEEIGKQSLFLTHFVKFFL